MPLNHKLSTILRKGLLSKLSGIATDVLRGDGTFGPPGNLTVRNLTSASSPYTVVAGDGFIRCDCSGGAITVNMPAASGNLRELTVKKIDSSANAVTIARAGADTIDGATTASLVSQWAVKKFVNGSSSTWDRVDTPTM